MCGQRTCGRPCLPTRPLTASTSIRISNAQLLLIITHLHVLLAGAVLPCSQDCVRLSEEMRALCESLDAGGIAAKMFAANVSFARCVSALYSRCLRIPGLEVITLMVHGIARNISALRACTLLTAQTLFLSYGNV